MLEKVTALGESVDVDGIADKMGIAVASQAPH
jgi:hypothetical protein